MYGRKHVTETHEYVCPVIVPRWVLNKTHFVHSHLNYCVLETNEYLFKLFNTSKNVRQHTHCNIVFACAEF